MSDFNAAKGELVPGGLALVFGLTTECMNGKIVVTENPAIDGDHYNGRIVITGGRPAWRCKGNGLFLKKDGVFIPSEYSYILEINLIPIKPEPDPLQVQTEQEKLA